jgi:hypothetical protein
MFSPTDISVYNRDTAQSDNQRKKRRFYALKKYFFLKKKAN